MANGTSALTKNPTAALLEQVVVEGDLAAMSAEQRLDYYSRVCESVGLNPLTKPFQYLRLSGKLTLYATKDATDQMRKLNGVSVRIVSRERVEDVWVVTAEASDSSGRTDASIGAVPIAGLKGDALANALMKAETKAKRRVTLSICGLGWLDETEIETIPAARAQAVSVDTETGEIAEAEEEEEEVRIGLMRQCRSLGRVVGRERAQAALGDRRLDDLSIEDLETLASRLESTADKESEG